VTTNLKHQELLERVQIRGTPGGLNLIAYSGGVDSTLVARLVYEVFPQNTLAVIGVSHAMPREQLELARDLAHHIGVPLRELPTTEGEVAGYVANAGESCYHCKTTLYQTMEDFSRALALELRERAGEVVLFNGTNADDLTDPTRLGLLAAREYRVASPLEALSKDSVRALSRDLGLPNWSYAASPCLRSRLQYGVPATPVHLRQVEVAEQVVRRRCGLSPQENLRVRHLAGDVACIELDPPWIDAALAGREGIEAELLALGYAAVSIRPFRSGSLSYLADIAV